MKTVKVLIAGAGPSGTLLAINLLKHNASTAKNVVYKVTVVDRLPPTLQAMDADASHRSWMISLSAHGLLPLREHPDLYENYIKSIGVKLESLIIHVGKRTIESSFGDVESYAVDRNFIVAALQRYLGDMQDPNLTILYETELLYVDGPKHRVLLRDVKGKEYYEGYDWLCGCDGIRSVVREAVIKRHSDFVFDIGDTFSWFKAAHLECPEGMALYAVRPLANCLPGLGGVILPETGNLLNLTLGVPRNQFEKIHDDLKSDDPKVVEAYLRQHFQSFEPVSYSDWAQQWVNQRWNRTGMTHANFYHSQPLRIVLLGDSVHATSPAIGMGMNMALKDAQDLARILRDNNDDIEATMEAYTKERVPEGNALSDLAMHVNCFSNFHQLLATFQLIVRPPLSKWFPGLVLPHPQEMLGITGYSLADCYDMGVRIGLLTKHRRINERIQREYFERQVGMIKPHPFSWWWWLWMLAPLVGGMGYYYYKVYMGY